LVWKIDERELGEEAAGEGGEAVERRHVSHWFREDVILGV